VRVRKQPTPEAELEQLEEEIREHKRTMEQAVASEAAGGDAKTARATWERAEAKAAELRPQVARLREVVKVRRDAERDAERKRHAESEAIRTAVNQALAGGHRFIQIGRLDERLWKRAWEEYRTALEAWVDDRRAEAANEEGRIPKAAAEKIATVEAFLDRSIDDLIQETRGRTQALVEA
jgi:hypothetical protein